MNYGPDAGRVPHIFATVAAWHSPVTPLPSASCSLSSPIKWERGPEYHWGDALLIQGAHCEEAQAQRMSLRRLRNQVHFLGDEGSDISSRNAPSALLRSGVQKGAWSWGLLLNIGILVAARVWVHDNFNVQR